MLNIKFLKGIGSKNPKEDFLCYDSQFTSLGSI